MKVIKKLSIAGRTLLTLDGDVLSVNADKVFVDGKEYEYDIAFDMKNTIGIKSTNIEGNTVEFVKI